MIYISDEASNELLEYLKSKGHDIRLLCGSEYVSAPVSKHADIYYCKLGAEPEAPVFKGDPKKLGCEYPLDVLYCAAVAGSYIICKEKVISKELLMAAQDYITSPIIIDVPQGYAKCNLAVIDDTHVITEDRGIYSRIKDLPNLNTLLISPSHVALKGYSHGFIGGCCGRVDDEILFNGDLSMHPECAEITAFIESTGLRIKSFNGRLNDIGSIIEEI